MFKFKSLFRFLAVGFGIIAILSISPVCVSASEKSEVFVPRGYIIHEVIKLRRTKSQSNRNSLKPKTK